MVGLLRRQHAGGLVQDQDVRAAEQRLEDLDPLLHADRQLADRGVEIDLQPVVALQRCDLGPGRWPPPAEREPPSAPSSRFSSTVNGSTSMKCWWTMPMPALIASCGPRMRALPAVDQDRAAVGLVEAVEDVHQRRLAGAVLADDAVDRSRPATTRSIARLAWTAPKRLSMPRSSTAGGSAPGSCVTLGCASGTRRAALTARRA